MRWSKVTYPVAVSDSDIEKGDRALDTGERSDRPFKLSESEYMDQLDGLLHVLRRWLWFIMAVVIVFVGGAVGVSSVQKPTYEASIEMLVKKQKRDVGDSLSSEIQGLQQLTLTMVELIDSRPVAESVIRELDMQTTVGSFLERLSVEQVNATPIIRVAYEDSSPRRAQQVVNTIGDVFSERISEDSVVADDVTVTVWETAILPQDPVRPDFVLNIGAALVMGLVLGIGLAFVLEHLSQRSNRSKT